MDKDDDEQVLARSEVELQRQIF